MKRILLVAAATLFSSTALAADLYNRDARPYVFTFRDGGLVSKSGIGQKGTRYGICTPTSQCAITIGKQTVLFNTSSKVFIEKGKISVR